MYFNCVQIYVVRTFASILIFQNKYISINTPMFNVILLDYLRALEHASL